MDGKPNLKFIRRCINAYANLFKEYGKELIDSKEKFTGYYPEWT